jgi:hypothetical protein
MAGAQEALQAYIRRVESESERQAALRAQQQQAPTGMGWGGWMPGPIILLNQFGDQVSHGGFGSSAGGDWGGGGFSGGGDWGGGGGSSGGGGW